MKATKYNSIKTGHLAKGCRQCVKGRKLVLFITGICSKKCWFCPLSSQKKNNDVIYANEWKLKNENDVKTLFREAELCESYGAGITGGDPLLKINRTVKYIKLLKNKFGKKFHIHLYTPLVNVTKEKLEKLYLAGLDEIRIHPDFDSKKYWKNVEYFKEYDWDFGMEIPVIPKKDLKKVIDYFAPYISFLNLNELEISDNNIDGIRKRKFKPKDEYSYAVKGSESLAIKLIKYYEKKYPKLNVHFCTTKLKDAVQLANRLKIRSKNAKTKFDKLTGEGMIIRNCIYLKPLVPGFSYREKLDEILDNTKKKNNFLRRLKKLQSNLEKIGVESIVDDLKLRLIIYKKNLKRVKGENVSKAIVEEYPTSDGMEVEVEFVD